MIAVLVVGLMFYFNPKRWIRRLAVAAFAAFSWSLYLNFELYYNDVAVSNNTILVQTDSRKLVFVSQNALNFLTTDNDIFFMQTEGWVHQLKSNSIKISLTNDRLRRNFFQQMKGNIEFIKKQN